MGVQWCPYSLLDAEQRSYQEFPNHILVSQDVTEKSMKKYDKTIPKLHRASPQHNIARLLQWLRHDVALVQYIQQAGLR